MMSLKLKYTLPLLLITLLCIGGVEAFYYFLGKQITPRQAPDQAVSQSIPDQPIPAEMNKEEDTAKETASVATGPGPEKASVAAGRDNKEIDVKAITDRNLFSSREGKLADKEVKDPLEGMELSTLDVVLMGTITGPNDDQRAIIYDKKERRQDLYQEGDFVQQAAIKQILRGKVIITLNGQDEMLDISEARNVNVPQVKKPAVPVTTARRVVGRPVGGSNNQQSSTGVIRPVSGSNVTIPRTGGARQLRSFRGGVIVKGRNTSGQNTPAQ